jgi:hypothetical protein
MEFVGLAPGDKVQVIFQDGGLFFKKAHDEKTLLPHDKKRGGDVKTRP